MDRTDAFEFFVFLVRGTRSFCGAEPLQSARLELLMDNLEETRQQIGFAVAGGGLVNTNPPGQDGALAATTEQRLAGIAPALHRQGEQLVEIGAAVAWLRRLLHPARAIWRRMRRPSNRQEPRRHGP